MTSILGTKKRKPEENIKILATELEKVIDTPKQIGILQEDLKNLTNLLNESSTLFNKRFTESNDALNLQSTLIQSNVEKNTERFNKIDSDITGLQKTTESLGTQIGDVSTSLNIRFDKAQNDFNTKFDNLNSIFDSSRIDTNLRLSSIDNSMILMRNDFNESFNKSKTDMLDSINSVNNTLNQKFNESNVYTEERVNSLNTSIQNQISEEKTIFFGQLEEGASNFKNDLLKEVFNLADPMFKQQTDLTLSLSTRIDGLSVSFNDNMTMMSNRIYNETNARVNSTLDKITALSTRFDTEKNQFLQDLEVGAKEFGDDLTKKIKDDISNEFGEGFDYYNTAIKSLSTNVNDVIGEYIDLDNKIKLMSTRIFEESSLRNTGDILLSSEMNKRFNMNNTAFVIPEIDNRIRSNIQNVYTEMDKRFVDNNNKFVVHEIDNRILNNTNQMYSELSRDITKIIYDNNKLIGADLADRIDQNNSTFVIPEFERRVNDLDKFFRSELDETTENLTSQLQKMDVLNNDNLDKLGQELGREIEKINDLAMKSEEEMNIRFKDNDAYISKVNNDLLTLINNTGVSVLSLSSYLYGVNSKTDGVKSRVDTIYSTMAFDSKAKKATLLSTTQFCFGTTCINESQFKKVFGRTSIVIAPDATIKTRNTYFKRELNPKLGTVITPDTMNVEYKNNTGDDIDVTFDFLQIGDSPNALQKVYLEIADTEFGGKYYQNSTPMSTTTTLLSTSTTLSTSTSTTSNTLPIPTVIVEKIGNFDKGVTYRLTGSVPTNKFFRIVILQDSTLPMSSIKLFNIQFLMKTAAVASTTSTPTTAIFTFS